MKIDSSSNTRIARNTIYLYFRMFLTMAIGLYASRVVLRVLGASDYGLYNVVGGILTMFTMISSALQVGTQRFLSYAIGENDAGKLNRTFSIAFGLHVIVALVVVILAESVGLWFLNKYLNIPEGREYAANWVYQFTIVGFVFSFLQVPFQSCIIAHERMNVYAYMSIYDAVMKLAVVFILPTITIDKLILYSALILLVQISSILIYNYYCRRSFEECSFKVVTDKELTKEILAYSGWNLFGGSVNLFANQGVNILLNIFCGTVVNAARGLATTISGIINQFVNNFQVAANPQIVKLYAAKEYEAFYKLLINNARVAIYLFLLIAIPAFLEIRIILKLWLGEYPEYTDIFIRIMLIEFCFRSINQPILYSIHASGQMKWQNIVSSSLLFLIFPLSWIALKLGYPPTSVFIISAFFWSTNNVICLYYSHKYTGLSVRRVIKEVYLNSLVGGSIMFLIPWLVSTQFDQGVTRFVLVVSTSLFVSVIVIYFWGLTSGMRYLLMNKTKAIMRL